MLPTYLSTAASRSHIALAALRLTIRPSILFTISPSSVVRTNPHRLSSSASSTPTPPASSSDLPDPLAPNIPLSSLGLPLHPLPLPLPATPSSTVITREALHRLHRLSALKPPADGSEEEAELLEGLKGLVGLMDAVKAVQLPQAGEGETGSYGGLLGRGVGELVLDFSESGGEARSAEPECDGKRGRELLEYATRRKGEFYASRLPQKTDQ